jgi:two-component system sensor kinase FixL
VHQLAEPTAGDPSDSAAADRAAQFASNASDRLAALVTSSDDAIIGKTLDGKVVDWNRGAATIFGYTEAEMIGQPIAMLVPAGEADDIAPLLDRLKRGERIDHYETRRRRKDGTIIDVSLTISPIHDRDGRILGFSKVARDVTLLRRQRALVERSEAHLKSILETVPDAMVVFDATGAIQSFSQTAQTLFGYPPDEAIRLDIARLLAPHEREAHEAFMASLAGAPTSHGIGQSRKLTARRRDGALFPAELTIGEMRSTTGRLFTGFVRDLTEKAENEKRLNDLQAELVHIARFTAMGEMASTLAHELNQPLTAIASYLNGCRRLLGASHDPQAEILHHAVERAADQALRAGEIIRRLRGFVRRGETQRTQANLAALIEEACALALLGAREHGVCVNFAFDNREREVLVDKIQIQQVVLNLVRNAVEAMQESAFRELTISTAALKTDGVIVCVGDTGPGISDAVAAQLFQPFVTTKRHGMGVGLSISRTIVEAHGGHLWMEPNPAGGAMFLFSIKGAQDAG